MIARCPSWLYAHAWYFRVALPRPDLPEGDITDPAVCSRPGAERAREGVHPRLSKPGSGRAAFGDGPARPPLPQGQERRGGAAHVTPCCSIGILLYWCGTYQYWHASVPVTQVLFNWRIGLSSVVVLLNRYFIPGGFSIYIVYFVP